MARTKDEFDGARRDGREATPFRVVPGGRAEAASGRRGRAVLKVMDGALSDAPASPGRPRPRAEGGGDRLSDAEIANLVASALECALVAAEKPDPRSFLHRRAEAGRSALRLALAALPPAQSGDRTVIAEYRKALALEAATEDLAFGIVTAIRRCAAAADAPTPRGDA